jgi:hypothetical protein
MHHQPKLAVIAELELRFGTTARDRQCRKKSHGRVASRPYSRQQY